MEYDKLKRYIAIQAPDVDRQTKTPWISADTWKLIDIRTSKNKHRSFLTNERQRLTRRIKRAINRDRKQRTNKAGEEIEQHLQAGRLKAAWDVMQAWYKHTGDRPPKPTRIDLRTVTNAYKQLYQSVPLSGDPLSIHITPCTINDDIPTEQEIATAIRKLRNGKASGHSGLRAEHLKTLLHQAEKDDATPDDRKG
jgi:hypothetical protein